MKKHQQFTNPKSNDIVDLYLDPSSIIYTQPDYINKNLKEQKLLKTLLG